MIRLILQSLILIIAVVIWLGLCAVAVLGHAHYPASPFQPSTPTTTNVVWYS